MFLSLLIYLVGEQELSSLLALRECALFIEEEFKVWLNFLYECLPSQSGDVGVRPTPLLQG